MALVLNEEQRLLQDTAREFLNGEAPVSALRKLRDEHDELGYDPELWRKITEMGWASIILPEAYGGLAFGFPGLGAGTCRTRRIRVHSRPAAQGRPGDHGINRCW